ncbi:MAG: platelet-activating factor acetylhydrolase IB subunit [Opitutaceae bacterium]|nr:platelet-activating factor acetylhydrolase IB subunit [Opitutaceae bacterium]
MHTSLLRPFSASVAALLATGLFIAGCTSAPRAVIDPALLDPAKNSAVRPAPRDANWVKRHEGFVDIARKGGVDVLFLGDSITDAWRSESARGGKKVWDREFAPLHAANFGISGDRTQHVLWRLQNGESDGIQPKAVVLMIGTNNTGFETDKVTPRNTPAETVAGVATIVNTLRTKFPRAKIMLLAVFPRGEKPDHPQRLQVNEINRGLVGLADGKTVRHLDIGPKFLQPDGTLPKDIMPDFLHPGAAGYEIWAAAIKQPLLDMLRGS